MNILLVKLSSLGDVVHTMPALQDLRMAYPEAAIDWVVETAFAPLVARCRGLHRVIPCVLRRWRKNFWSAATRREWLAFKAALQERRYDAVIDLHGLTKSALIARVARLTESGARYGLANRTEGASHEPPARWLVDHAIRIEPHTHALDRSRLLVASALGYTLDANPTPHVRLGWGG